MTANLPRRGPHRRTAARQAGARLRRLAAVLTAHPGPAGLGRVIPAERRTRRLARGTRNQVRGRRPQW